MSIDLPLKILVVDDMSSIRDALIECLSGIGLDMIYEAVDGDDATTIAKDHAEMDDETPFDVIFSDINMPNCNGIEFLQRMRGTSSYSKTPIIMVTTENEASTVLEAIESGADEYIIKPFDQSIVEAKLTVVLQKRNIL
jgi:two-component system chemotaxis response regulator CheY